jgi:hypothetical protein
VFGNFFFYSLFRSANEEKLQIIEDHEKYLEKLRKDLHIEKEKEEKKLRDKMKADLE